jgi:hypothetical protein
MCNRFEIIVEGIDDASLVSAVETAIRDSFREMALPGSWRVVVRPSHATGQWAFTIYGLDVRHSLSIAVPPHLLPNLIPRRLRELLDRAVGRGLEGAVPPPSDVPPANDPALSRHSSAAPRP